MSRNSKKCGRSFLPPHPKNISLKGLIFSWRALQYGSRFFTAFFADLRVALRVAFFLVAFFVAFLVALRFVPLPLAFLVALRRDFFFVVVPCHFFQGNPPLIRDNRPSFAPTWYKRPTLVHERFCFLYCTPALSPSTQQTESLCACLLLLIFLPNIFQISNFFHQKIQYGSKFFITTMIP